MGVFLIGGVDLGIPIPAKMIELLTLSRHITELLERYKGICDLRPGIIDVILHLRPVPDPLQHIIDDVTEYSIPKMTDMYGLVRIDIRVLENDLFSSLRKFCKRRKVTLHVEQQKIMGKKEIEESRLFHLYPPALIIPQRIRESFCDANWRLLQYRRECHRDIGCKVSMRFQIRHLNRTIPDSGIRPFLPHRAEDFFFRFSYEIQ